MKRRFVFALLFPGAFALSFSGLLGAPTSSRDQARLDTVAEYANTVLRDAGDHYRPSPTPLLANGVNVFTQEPLTWTFPDGRVAVMADFVEQQNLMRVLAALTNLTGEPKFKAAAKAQYAYYFAHYQDQGGLLQWGGHRFVDLRSLDVMGFSGVPVGDSPHELKNAYPYYELMYEVNPEATARYIVGFWNAHVYD